MAAKYRRIDPRIWSDEKFRQLDQFDKLVVFELLTGQANRIGLFYVSPALASEHLGCSHETFLERLLNVCETLAWVFDNVSRTLFIPRWWKYNQPANPNVLAGALRDLHDVPQTPLIELFRQSGNQLTKMNRKRFEQVCENCFGYTSSGTGTGTGAGAGAAVGGTFRSGSDSDPPRPIPEHPDDVDLELHARELFGDWREQINPVEPQSSALPVLRARLTDGWSPEQLRLVITRKAAEVHAEGASGIRYKLRNFFSDPSGDWLELLSDSWEAPPEDAAELDEAKSEAEEAKRQELIAQAQKHGDAQLADGTTVERIGIYHKQAGTVTWNRVSTGRLEQIVKELLETGGERQEVMPMD